MLVHGIHIASLMNGRFLPHMSIVFLKLGLVEYVQTLIEHLILVLNLLSALELRL